MYRSAHLLHKRASPMYSLFQYIIEEVCHRYPEEVCHRFKMLSQLHCQDTMHYIYSLNKGKHVADENGGIPIYTT